LNTVPAFDGGSGSDDGDDGNDENDKKLGRNGTHKNAEREGMYISISNKDIKNLGRAMLRDRDG
jgi:hypothetical protein